MGFVSDLRVLYHLTFTRARGQTHGERLESFYRSQAGDYDAFRCSLLHGREEMIQGLEFPDRPGGPRMLDVGGGTGINAEFLGDRLQQLQSLHIVDLCPSLLAVAQERARKQGWDHVHTVLADATTLAGPPEQVDLATFSYSLTMIPDWFRAIDRAYELLQPGGMIGVVDFYVSRKWPAPGMRRHRAWQRWFWPTWFSWDNVFLSSEHLPYLQSRFRTVRLEERSGRVPYLLGLKVPYYIFHGRKE
jgi:S-adenosylmethionine-diacylgycerolhomoserine-N-methlytransferase